MTTSSETHRRVVERIHPAHTSFPSDPSCTRSPRSPSPSLHHQLTFNITTNTPSTPHPHPPTSTHGTLDYTGNTDDTARLISPPPHPPFSSSHHISTRQRPQPLRSSPHPSHSIQHHIQHSIFIVHNEPDSGLTKSYAFTTSSPSLRC